MKNLESKYIFAVFTYGIVPANSIKTFQSLISMCGGRLSLGYAVQMPHNGMGSGLFSKEQQLKMFDEWTKRSVEIAKDISMQKEGIYEKSGRFFKLITTGLLIKMFPFIIKLLKQVILKGPKSLELIPNEKCNGCGICRKVCPVDNIDILNGKPVWLDRGAVKICASCGACFHWCPENALQMGNSNLNFDQYHHPDASIGDILKQKNFF